MQTQQHHPPPLVYNPAASGIPMLPPGWVEYRAPTGQPYWYNTMTRQSSWIFPTAFSAAIAPPPLPSQAMTAPKRKHQIKKKIPGTHWLFVITPHGYEFYYDRETKKSVWDMPEELKEPMELLKKQEDEEKEKQRKEEEESRKRQLEAEGALEQMEEAKRIKLEDVQLSNEEQQQEDTQQQQQEEHEEKQGDDEAQPATEMTEEDILWQLQQMEQDQVEEEQEEEEEDAQKEPQVQDLQQPLQSTEVEKAKENKLAEEECIAKFNELLAERNISPYAVYSVEYPKLMSDPRFSLIPSHKQKALFNKYCNALGERNKQEKARKKKPEEEFRELLEEKVSKKMYWEDFRRKYKNDPRFKLSHSSMTTKEKEALFKDHVKHHLNKSRLSSSPKERYFQLLRDTKEIRNGIRWRDAKKILEKDDRFWLIESKEEREDLFRDYLEGVE